jgi:hypothetical protein
MMPPGIVPLGVVPVKCFFTFFSQWRICEGRAGARLTAALRTASLCR